VSLITELIVSAMEGVDNVERGVFNFKKEIEDDIGSIAMYIALQAMGLDFREGDDVNRATLSAKISSDVLGGDIVFKDIFDREQVLADVRRMALAKASSLYGFDAGLGVAGLRDKVVTDVLRDVLAEIGAGSGDFVDAAPDSARALAIVDAPKNDDWNTPTDFSVKGESNRARQAKYRASHKRVWE
jgi:hypothetical protein